MRLARPEQMREYAASNEIFFVCSITTTLPHLELHVKELHVKKNKFVKNKIKP